jgi:DNA-binding Lrp family transcriptional regulator
LSVDETTDKLGRPICALVIGTLAHDGPSDPILLDVSQLQRVNSASVAQFVQDGLLKLWPTGIQYEKVRLFVSDAAAYMKKAARCLRMLFSRMLHVTCAAHGLHNVAELIRAKYQRVNSLIANCKTVFVKAPLRVQLYKAILPGVPLPPEPVITRWGTWIDAVQYYATHLADIKRVFSQLDKNDATSINRVKKLLSDSSLQRDLVYVSANYGFLADSIKKLEKKGVTLTGAVEVVDHAETALRLTRGRTALLVQRKFDAVFEKNKGLRVLRAVSKVLSDDLLLDEEAEFLNEYEPSELADYRFAPIVSCDVERVFSRFKSVLRANRESFTVEHIKWHLVCMCNATD